MNRMASFINQYIHKDQVGFIPGSQGPYQVRRAIDIVSILQSGWEGGPRQEGMLLSLDLQKVFDLVSWPYLFAVLRRWGFGPNFIGLLEALYSVLEARARLQGYCSDPIKIARGTRQGCPLSPLIFAMAIESLATAIQTHPDIGGFSVARHLISVLSSQRPAPFYNFPPLFLSQLMQTTGQICQYIRPSG